MTAKLSSSAKSARLTQRFVWVAGVVSLILLTVLAISSVFFRRYLDDSQELRDSAAVKNGIVSLVGPEDAAKYPLSSGIVTLPLALTPSNLSGQYVQTNGLEVSFDIVGPLKGAPSISLASTGTDTKLKIAAVQVTSVPSKTPHYLVNVIVVPEDPTRSLQISRYTPVLLVSFVPEQPGTGSINFNQSLTRVITHKTTSDVLNTINPIMFTIVNDVEITPTPVSGLKCEWCGSQCVPVGSAPTCAKTLGPVSGICQPNANGTSCVIVKNTPTPTKKIGPTPPVFITATPSTKPSPTKPPIKASPSPTKRPGATPPVVITATPVPTSCAANCSNWGPCKEDGYQYRSCQSNNCPQVAAPVQRRQCYAQCFHQYSAWTQCKNGWQTRTATTQPTKCYWYEQTPMEELGRSCAPYPVNFDFKTYTYEACWYGNSAGSSLYFMWKETQFPGATWIDVSTSPDFNGTFANKNLGAYPLFTIDGYQATSGAGFTSGGKAFTFSPGVRYYARLWNGSRHSGVISLYMPQCQGTGGPTLRYCNESCANNSECAPNLFCNSGVCRHPANPGNEYCTYPTGDKGLNRSCNEYCADNKECSAGMTCWWNRCRNPINVESTSCQSTTLVVTANNCNAACTSNSQCSTNFLCYYGVCRRATNPLSTSCGAYSATPAPEKGDTSFEEVLLTDEEIAEATKEAKISVTATPGAGSAVAQVKDETKEELTAWDSIWNWLESKGISPFVLVGLLALLLLILLLLSSKRKPPQAPPQAPLPGKAPTPPQLRPATTTSAFGQPLPPMPNPASIPPRPGMGQPVVFTNPNNPLSGPSGSAGMPVQPTKLS